MSHSPNWSVHPQVRPSPELIAACDGRAILAELLVQRGIETPDQARAFLHPDHYTPAPPTAMIGVAKAVSLLGRALNARQRILIWGDFDVDGQTSTALLTQGLQQLARNPDHIRWHVPHRLQDNHGILPDRLQEFLEDPEWQPDVLVTCDTGIDEVEGLARARAANLTIIVTDHHDLPPALCDLEPGEDPVLPRTLYDEAPRRGGDAGIRSLADAIINPKLLSPTHPQYCLPGVGIAFLLLQHLYATRGKAKEVLPMLDLVALGIVADAARQKADTRYWLQQGMARLNRTDRLGLRVLLETIGKAPGTLTVEDIAFAIAPRMNAAGRLGDASRSVRLLLTLDRNEALKLSREIDHLNRQRRTLGERQFQQAQELLELRPELLGAHAIVLARKNWHRGVLGITANRMAERYNRPTVLMDIGQDGMARGSARSVDGVDIGAAIASRKSLLANYGGHEQAAGVTMDVKSINEFRLALDNAIPHFTQGERHDGFKVDRILALNDISQDLYRELQALEPTGQGNPEPLFLSRNLTPSGVKVLKGGAHLRFRVRQEGHAYATNAIWFRAPFKRFPSDSIDLVYHLRRNEFRGRVSVEMQVQGWQASNPLEVTSQPSSRFPTDTQARAEPPFTIRDHRQPDTKPSLLDIVNGASWYAEGQDLTLDEMSPRDNLKGPIVSDHLIIWTVPPTARVLHALLHARPWKTVSVWACHKAEFDVPTLLQAVGRMCRFAIRQRDGHIDILRMACRLGLSPEAIQLSLALLVQVGFIRQQGHRIEYLPGRADAQAWQVDLAQMAGEDTSLLTHCLTEMRSWHHYFCDDDLALLLCPSTD